MTKQEILILKDELANDPLQRGYANMSNEEVANSLNTENIASRKLVPLWQVKKTIVEAGEWAQLIAAQSSSDSTVAGAAITAISYIDDPRFQNLDMDLTATINMINILKTNGILSEQVVNAVNALADTNISRAQQLGLPFVKVGHVELARL